MTRQANQLGSDSKVARWMLVFTTQEAKLHCCHVITCHAERTHIIACSLNIWSKIGKAVWACCGTTIFPRACIRTASCGLRSPSSHEIRGCRLSEFQSAGRTCWSGFKPRPSKLWIKIWVRLAGRWQEQYQILILLISFCWTTSLTNVRFPCKCQNDSSNENTRQQCGLPQGRSRFHCQKEHASTLGLTGKHTAKKQKSEYGLGLAKNWYRSKRQGAARPQWAKHIVLHMSNSPRAAHSWPRS